MNENRDNAVPGGMNPETVEIVRRPNLRLEVTTHRPLQRGPGWVLRGAQGNFLCDGDKCYPLTALPARVQEIIPVDRIAWVGDLGVGAVLSLTVAERDAVLGALEAAGLGTADARAQVLREELLALRCEREELLAQGYHPRLKEIDDRMDTLRDELVSLTGEAP